MTRSLRGCWALALLAAALGCGTTDEPLGPPLRETDGEADAPAIGVADVGVRPRDGAMGAMAPPDAADAHDADAVVIDASPLDPCGHAPDDASSLELAKTPINGYGFVNFSTSTQNEIVDLRTTLAVPPEPPASGTLFLWPGLQPAEGARSYLPIDNGVLQPVLTWGPTCAPNSPRNGYLSWWVSPQYVNTFGQHPGYTGCQGGEGLSVDVEDQIDMRMTLDGSVWKQTVTHRKTGLSVSFDIDMLGQAQNYAEFVIELAGQKPTSDVVFTSTSFTLASPEPSVCRVSRRGANDDFSTVGVSSDGRVCCVSRIVLRAQGVAATMP